MNKLTNIEAQRIMAVVNETIEKLEYLSHVEILSSLGHDRDSEKLRALVGDELSSAIVELQKAEARFESLFARQSGGNGIQRNPSGLTQRESYSAGREDSSKSRTPMFPPIHPDGSGVDQKEMAKTLRQASRNVCRLLKETPGAFEAIKRSYRSSSSISSFVNYLKELKALTHEKLLTTVEEEKSRQDHLSEIMLKEKRATLEKRNLEKELLEERTAKEKELSTRAKQIDSLTREISSIQKRNKEEATSLEKESKAREVADEKAFQEKEAFLRQEIKKMELLLDEKVGRHKENELQMRKKTHKSEQEVENWISKYDTEMEEKEKEIDKIQAIYDADKRELEDVEGKFSVVSSEWDLLMAERNKLEEARKKEEMRLRRLNEAATTIQAAWKGYRERQKFAKRKQTKKPTKPGRSKSPKSRSAGRQGQSAGSMGVSKPGTASSKPGSPGTVGKGPVTPSSKSSAREKK
eukprot:TRINITY_DN1902_c0_g1_i6.p1 TRINITY_DN1902_c0_g1~~TRINITY_DN1902_c0_g1_i6.p1  ORF type:complete len:466 (-),score=128.98 TRINITY_DN1902_c0_g1_i6:68-1465(-)